MPSRLRTLLPTCFFFSGASGLVLEVAWSKQLSFILGNSLYAVATVVAAFMAGLAAGSGLAGRYGARIGRPLRAYGVLQLGIGAFGLVSIPLLRSTTPLFRLLYHAAEGHGPFLLARFCGVFALLAIPATLMGMTLPVVVGALARGKTGHSLDAGTLYGVNTLGAVAGTFLSGFVLVSALGLLRTCLLAGVSDLVVGMAAIALDRRSAAAASAPAGALPARLARAQWAVAALFGLSGVVAMFYEVAWFRLLALSMGPSVYAFSAMLAMFLAGVGLGSALAAPWIARARLPGIALVGALEAGLAGLGLATLFLVNGLPMAHARLFAWSASRLGETSFTIAQLASAAVLVFVPCLLMGALFPAAVRAFQEAGPPGSPEANVGRLYTLNSAGSIAGSLVAGFWLIPGTGAWVTLAAAAIASAVLAVWAGWLSPGPGRVAWALPALPAVAFLGTWIAPGWDVAGYNQGLYRTAYMGGNLDADRGVTRQLVYHREGINAPVAVFNSSGDGFLKVSGKSDASTIPLDIYTQVLTGHLPLLLAPAPRRVAIIGYGSGMSVAAALSHPEVESLDLVELERAVLDASPFFASINGDPFRDPRLRLIVEDGRTHLAYTDRQYDVIVSEPSNPWMAGIGNLFTTDFYAAVRARLAPGGVFGQWIQAYQISDDTMRSVVATVHSEFPNVALFQLSPFDVMVIASDAPLARPWPEWRARVEQPPVLASLRWIRVNSACELAFFFRASGETLAAFGRGARTLNTDDNTWLEHRMPHELIEALLRPPPEPPGTSLLRAGAGHRLAGLRSLLPGFPAEECGPAMARYPHRSEPVTIPGRVGADPWSRQRGVLLQGMVEEATAAGEAALARALTEADAEGEHYRTARVGVTAELTGLLAAPGGPDRARLESALSRAPDHPLALVLMGDRELQDGHVDAAQARYQAVIDEVYSTATFSAMAGMARAALQRGDRAGALAWADRAIGRNPWVPDGFLLAARICREGGDEAGAVRRLREGLAYSPGEEHLTGLLGGSAGPGPRAAAP